MKARQSTVLSCQDVTVRFGGTTALDGVSLDLVEGEVVAVMGPSGCGKSTLLHVLSGLLKPDAGQVSADGCRIDALSDTARSRLRLRSFGFVLQFGDLVPELTLRENVELPLRLLGVAGGEARQRGAELLAELEIAELGERHTSQVSGGQAQRAAVARALVHDPSVVFADEPTGALDSAAGELVLEALLDAARTRDAAVVLVTHAAEVAARADRIVHMRDGRIADAVDPAGRPAEVAGEAR